MNALGLGMIAADAYFRQNRQQELDQQQRERYAAEKQRTDAENSTLGDATSARRAQLLAQRMQAEGQAKAQPGLDTLTQMRTDNQIQGERDNSALQPERQRGALANAKVAADTAEFNAGDMPNQVRDRRVQRANTNAQQHVQSIAQLAGVIKTGDSKAVLQYMNDLSDAQHGPGNHAPIAQVGYTKDPNTGENVFTALDANGKTVMQMSSSQMQRISDSLKPAPKVEKLKPGESLATVQPDGRASTVLTAPGDKEGTKQHTPAEIQSAEWLMKNGVATDATNAWNKVRSAREKTRGSFIADMIKDSITPKESPDSVRKKQELFGGLYDQIQREQGGGAPTKPGVNPAPGLDDVSRARINNLIGVP